MPLRSLFLDFNAYFASCEQHLQPALRGRPVAVTPVQAPGGSCIAVSYEARRCDIRVGTKVAEARARCPDIAIVPSRPEQYVELHHQLVALIDSCMYVERVFSIDELSCPLTGAWRSPERALALARAIKAKLRAFSPALKASIGLAPNTWLAKVGTELEKPDGLVLLRDADLPGRLCTLQLTDLPMISRGMEARLARHGVRSVEALYACSRTDLRRIWGGIDGERFHGWLHGQDVPAAETQRRHIGHSRVLPPDRRNATGVRATVFRLLQRAAIRLRREGYHASRLQLGLKFYTSPPLGAEQTLEPSCHTPTFIEALAQLWQRLPPDLPWAHAKSCSIVLTDLVANAAYTPSLFQQTERRANRLSQAADAVALRYGEKNLYFGCAFGGFDQGTAMRIAFNRIPDPL